jgi:hypothetical protein
MVYGDNGSTCTPNTGATANANQFVKAADVALRKGACLYKTWGKYGEGGQGQRQGGQDQGQGRTNGWDSRHYRQIINVLYLGGTSSANGASEGRKELTGEYILKGYLLEFVLAASNTGPVTWTFKKGTEEVGTFHNGSGWSDYGTTIAKGDDTVIYWRSDTGGQINDVYTVTATYMQDGQQVTTSRTLKSRSMAPDNPDLRDYFNEDVDMLQRVMIQICFLDKGRLDSWEIGKYRDNNTGSYYHSTVLETYSKIADEIENLGFFACGASETPATRDALKTTTYDGAKKDILWDCFGEIMAAGRYGEITSTTLGGNYDTTITAKIQATGVDNKFRSNDVDVTPLLAIKYIIKHESKNRHSYERNHGGSNLYWNSISVGNGKPAADGHNWTDYGLGFMKVQRYNVVLRNTNLNLYKYGDNIEAGCKAFKNAYDDARTAHPAWGPKWTLFDAYGRYNGAGDSYATKVFNDSNIALPDPNDKSD